MLESFTAITTAITAIISVWIAYKSHRTTIDERKREKEEFSIKLMDLHENKNEQCLNQVFLLSEHDIEITEHKSLYDFIKTKELDNQIVQYIKNTEKFKEEKIEQLSLENTKTLSDSISKSIALLTQIAILGELEHDPKVREIMIHHHGSKEKAYRVQNKEIQKSAKKLLNIFK